MEGNTDLDRICLFYLFWLKYDKKQKLLSVARRFEDNEVVRFIETNFEIGCFSQTRQFNKALWYIIIQNSKDITIHTPGFEDCLAGFLELGGSPLFIRYMIERGLYSNLQDELLTACRYGNYDTVKILLEAGADPRIRNNTGKSALQIAQKFNSEETFLLIFDALVQRKAIDNELIDCFPPMGPLTQDIIQEAQSDRTMLKMLYRWTKLGKETYLMNPAELGYCMERFGDYGDVMLLTLHVENKINDFETIHFILRRLYHQKKFFVILCGLSDAFGVISTSNILNLYAFYLYRLGMSFLELSM